MVSCFFFYPDDINLNKNAWFSAKGFKRQYQLAAILGTIATFLCIICDDLIISIDWLYTFSNFLWALSEYHKKNTPTLDTYQYTSKRQSNYYCYAILCTTSSFATAIVSTVPTLSPISAEIISPFMSCVSGTLGGLALLYLGRCIMDDYVKKDNTSQNTSSYRQSFYC